MLHIGLIVACISNAFARNAVSDAAENCLHPDAIQARTA